MFSCSEKSIYTSLKITYIYYDVLLTPGSVLQISYHSEFEKNVGKYTFVPDNPENERIRKTGAAISDIEYRGVRRDHNEMEAKRSSGVIDQTGVYKLLFTSLCIRRRYFSRNKFSN